MFIKIVTAALPLIMYIQINHFKLAANLHVAQTLSHYQHAH